MMIYQSGVLNVSIDKDLETSVSGRTQVKDPFINSEMGKDRIEMSGWNMLPYIT